MNLGIIRERKERKKKVPRPSHGSSFLFRGVSWERNLHPRWETVSNKQVVKNVYIYIYYYTHTFEENEKSWKVDYYPPVAGIESQWQSNIQKEKWIFFSKVTAYHGAYHQSIVEWEEVEGRAARPVPLLTSASLSRARNYRDRPSPRQFVKAVIIPVAGHCIHMYIYMCVCASHRRVAR